MNIPSSASVKPRISHEHVGTFAVIIGVFLIGLYIGIHQVQTYAQTSGNASSTSAIVLAAPGRGNAAEPPSDIDLSPLWLTWNLLNNNFVQSHASGTTPSDEEKMYGAIDGLMSSYGDPYTVFFPPSDAAVFDQNISGSFGGVGMEIGATDGQLVVVSPIKGSPAEAAGIRSGDKILFIDDTAASHMNVDEAVKIIRGPKGSTVKITVMQAGNTQPLVIPIVRDTIQIPTTKYSNHVGTGIFEIDLYNFSAASNDDFREALRAFFESGQTRLLLDLRGNPGGYLNAAVDMASYFLPSGDIVVTEDYRGRQNNVVHRSFGYNVFANKQLTMAILMDQGTASAAEILAGALQQHGVAKLVGTRSFGKGSVQELFDVGGGAEIKITVARWLTPNGTSISDGGLQPDIAATTTAKDFAAGLDPQKDAASAYLQIN